MEDDIIKGQDNMIKDKKGKIRDQDDKINDYDLIQNNLDQQECSTAHTLLSRALPEKNNPKGLVEIMVEQ